MLTYDEMVEKTREFYDELQIDISDKYVDLAVRSLTMPQYAKEFNDKFHKEIGDHRALATVGDVICAAYKTECIRAIYFGLNINEENKESILEAIASIRLKCDIYEAYIDENNFYVQYRKIYGA